ncbi:MAG: hypothetical protein OXG81_14850 [Acidobacteria bacterium]|nr:hypothetical protein [Acidobacteriota bacterium]
MIAALYGHADIVEMLLHNNANVNHRNAVSNSHHKC